MPLTDAELLDLMQQAASALDVEAAWLVDVDVDAESLMHQLPAVSHCIWSCVHACVSQHTDDKSRLPQIE